MVDEKWTTTMTKHREYMNRHDDHVVDFVDQRIANHDTGDGRSTMVVS